MSHNKFSSILGLFNINKPNASLSVNIQFYLKRKLGRKGDHIFIACFPKSGSTYLAQTLNDLLGFKFTYFISSFNRTEHEIDFPSLVDSYTVNTVTHQHARATEGNILALKACQITPIVLVRNIFDCVVSLRDHFEKETYKWPMAFATEEYYKLEEDRKMDFLISLFVPWYFNFYVSWVEAIDKNEIRSQFFSYEDLIGNEVSLLTEMLEFVNLGAGISQEEMSKVVQKSKNQDNARFNIGRQGRGRQTLSDAQIQRIEEFASFYPWVDFTRIGIS